MARRRNPDDWSQGIPLAYMQRVHDYWLNEYDFRSREAALNRWPAFIRRSMGWIFTSYTFVHQRGRETTLMTHGWPGSVVEFQNVIGPLTDPDNHGHRVNSLFTWSVLPSRIRLLWQTKDARLGHQQNCRGLE